MDKTLQINRRNNGLYFTLRGDVTLTHTPSLKPLVDEALKGDAYEVVIIDLSRTDSMDSSGIGFLVTLNTGVKKMGKGMILYKPGKQICKTLEMVQLLDYFQIASTEDELLAMVPE